MRKKFSWIIYIITLSLMILLQTSFFPQFILLKIKPDLALLFVVSVGLLKGYQEGVITGAIAGILTGLISWNLWGIYILGYCLSGFAAGLVSEKVMPDNIIIPLLSGLAGSLGFTILFSLLGQSLELFFLTGYDFYKTFIFLAWNCAFSIPIFIVAKYVLVSPGTEVDLDSTKVKDNYLIQ